MNFSFQLFILIFLLFSNVTLAGISSSPRVLITLGHKCNFTPELLQKKVGAIVVNGTGDEVKNEIIELDQTSSNHLIVLKNRLKDIDSFSNNMGYATLHLNNKLQKALSTLKKTLATIPTTDRDLPHMDPLQVGLFYDLMIKVASIFKEHGILYWGVCGTLLGTVRHQGMIPWDDDIDIAIFEKDVPLLLSLKESLEELGLGICDHPELEFYKIFFLSGDPIIYENGYICPWTFPFIDIFPMTEMEGKITYVSQIWQQYYNYKERDFFWAEELQFPLQELPFGPLFIPIPQNPIKYIKRMYGNDWNDVAYVTYSHRYEKRLKKVKVELLDRSAPPYILPSHLTGIFYD